MTNIRSERKTVISEDGKFKEETLYEIRSPKKTVKIMSILSQNVEHRTLKLCKDQNRQIQYSGFDPSLRLPDAFNETRSLQFLKSLATFADSLEKIKERTDKLFNYYNRDTELRKRAFFNTSIVAGNWPLSKGDYMIDYMNKTWWYSFSKLESFGLNPSSMRRRERFDNFTNLVTIFEREILTNSQISARDFFDTLCRSIKIQYTEPMFLYIGQTIKELIHYAEDENLPDEIKETLHTMLQYYKESGLEKEVAFLRALANTEEIKAEKRVKVIAHNFR